MSTRYLFINQVSFVFIFGLHIKKVIFGLCNDIPADSYVCLTTVKARDDKVTALYAFFFSSTTLFLSQTLTYFQIYCLVYGFLWLLCFSTFPICCMPISQFSNNIKLWFVESLISSTWWRCLGEKECWNNISRIRFEDFCKIHLTSLQWVGGLLEVLWLPVFCHA